MDLSNKVVAITGANSGIGLQLTQQCLAKGAKVAASDLATEALEPLANNASDKLLITTLNVTDRIGMTQWHQAICEQYGHCDVLINNAGVSLSSLAAQQSREDFEWLMNINFWGVVNGVEAFLPTLLTRPQASLVNLSSIFGIIGVPSQSAYNASKFAVRGYSEAMRQELADSPVQVLTVHPGGVKTNIVRHGRHYNDTDGSATDMETMAAQFEGMARTTADSAATQIINAIETQQCRLLIGADARLMDRLQRVFPSGYERVLSRLLKLVKR